MSELDRRTIERLALDHILLVSSFVRAGQLALGTNALELAEYILHHVRELEENPPLPIPPPEPPVTPLPPIPIFLGWFIIIPSLVWVFPEPTARVRAIGAIEGGKLVKVYKLSNGWAEIEYKDDHAYIQDSTIRAETP